MNLLITGAWQEAGKYINEIRSMGHAVCFLQWERDALPCDPVWVEGVIGNGLFLTHPIETFPNLRYIQLTSAGLDRVPVEYIKERGITICNARGVYSIPMAEHAVAGVLCLYRQMNVFFRQQEERLWEKRRGLAELSGKEVLIVGCGSVGTECAVRFRAFGCRVCGIDLFPREDAAFDAISGIEQLDARLPDTDILILTVPLSDGTRHLIDRERMLMLKKNAVIVNLARGGVLDLDAFVSLKQQGSSLMAVLDVFEEEPLRQDHPVWAMEDVVVTPHNSFIGEGNGTRLAQVILGNLKKQEKET